MRTWVATGVAIRTMTAFGTQVVQTVELAGQQGGSCMPQSTSVGTLTRSDVVAGGSATPAKKCKAGRRLRLG